MTYPPLASGLAPVLSLLAAASASAQGTVHVVDDDGGFDFTTLQAAVDAAAEGDTVLVRSGSYASVVIDGKSLSVVADADAKALVTGTVFGADVIVVRNLSGGQQVVLRGLDVPLAAPAIDRAVELVDNAGAVWIEDVTVTPNPATGWIATGTAVPDAMVVAENCAVVNLTRVQVTGNPGAVLSPSGLTIFQESSLGADALRADGSTLSIWDCALTGGIGSTATFGPTDAPIASTNGGDGLEMRGGSLFASGSSFAGGRGGGANPFFWGCLAASDGGNGLYLELDAPSAISLDCAFVAGAEGPEGVCSPSGLPGQTVLVDSGSHATLPGAARSLSISSPHREGESATFSYVGEPGDIALDAIGASQQHVFLSVFSGVLTNAPIVLTTAGGLDATGQLSVDTPIPTFGNPARESAQVYVQPLFVELTGGPIPTATAYAGAGSVLTLLDGAL